MTIRAQKYFVAIHQNSKMDVQKVKNISTSRSFNEVQSWIFPLYNMCNNNISNLINTSAALFDSFIKCIVMGFFQETVRELGAPNV